MLRRAARALALAAIVLAALVPALGPAAAVGPSLQLTVSPPLVTATPSASGSGEANFTAVVDLFSNPVGAATIVVRMTSDHGWTISPPSCSFRVTAAGHSECPFVVEIPPDSVAGVADAVLVMVNYQVGGVSTYSDQVTVHAEAGPYYALTVRQASPAAVMDPGKNYAVSLEVRNEGNAPGSFSFTITDQAVLDRLRAKIDMPSSASIAGQNVSTVEILIVPGGTSPGGKYAVPVRVEVRDRAGTVQAVANVTMNFEVNNLAIYQGWLPNWDLTGPYTLGAFAFVALLIWFGFQFLFALGRARRDKTGIFAELSGGIRRSRLVRGVGGLLTKVTRRPTRVKATKAPLTPAEVKARSAARAPRSR